MAFTGVAVLVAARTPTELIGGALAGDALIGAAAVFYSLHVVRLGKWAPRISPIALARSKEVSRLVFASVTLALGLAISTDQVWTFLSAVKKVPSKESAQHRKCPA